MRRPGFFRAYAAPARKAPTVIQGEAGAAGDSWLANWAAGGDDTNPALSGSEKFRTYDEMRKTSPAVKSLLHFLSLPVRSAHWGVNPGVDDPLGRRIRDAVDWQFGIESDDGRLRQSWDELNQQALLMLAFGAMLEETVWAEQLETWRDADGNPQLLKPFDRIEPRMPTSIERVKMDRGRIVEVIQNIPGTRPIPGENVSHLVWERDGNRWEGLAWIRPAWGPWFFQKQLLIAAGIGWDRWASGIPEVRHPDNSDAEARAKSIGRNLAQHERAYVHFPGPAEGSEWGLTLHKGEIEDPTPLLKWCSDEIATVGLQNFARQGMGQTGARASAAEQVEPYYLAVQALAAYVARERRRQLIRRFVEVNFGVEAAATHMPKLTVSKIQGRNVLVIAEALTMLSPLGFHFTDQDEEDLREEMGLGRMPEQLADQGVTQEEWLQALRDAGLDPATLARVVNALPPGVGVKQNRVEGAGLAVAAANA